MQPRIRFVIGIFAAVFLCTAYVFTATQNQVPKYATDGTLVDSAIAEVGGKVGIGTTSPGKKLSVQTSGAYDGINVGDGTTTNLVQMHHNGAGGGYVQINKNSAATVLLHTSGDSYLMGGNIGIGTTTPSSKFHVVGNVTVDGNIGAKYQDIAEWVDATVHAPAGSVVVADSDRLNHVRPSNRPYDTAVAGVVSRKPGVLLGEAGPGKLIIAQSGRVYVNVDASRGSIKAGDLLVTSSVTGYAMRSQPVLLDGAELHRPGTILGKALEPFAQGKGEILVLITLQ